MEPASIFGLVKGAFEAIKGVFGVVAPKLDLTYEAGKTPYAQSDATVFWRLNDPDESGHAATATQLTGTRRWYQVGVRNRSLQTVDDVRVELASIDPPAIAHLPLALEIMHGAPQPLTLHRAKEPTIFAAVVLKVDEDTRIHVMSAPRLPRDLGGLPAGRYRLAIRVTGRNTPAVTRHYVADVGERGQLTFAQE